MNEGESYFSKDGVDWKDGYVDGTPGKDYNACIKAFTVNGGSGSGYNGGHGGDGSSVQPQAVEITPEKEGQVRSAIEDLDLPGVDLLSVAVWTFSKDTAAVGSTRDASLLTPEEMKAVSGDGKVPAAILPEITIWETGVYCFLTSLDIAIPVGAVLEWHSFPQSEANSGSVELASARLADGDGTAVFMKNGRTITTVPADHEVEVAAYFEKGKTYAPVIAAVTASGGENDEKDEDGKDLQTPTSSKGSGGCDALSGGVVVLSLACLAAWRARRRKY